MGKNGGKWDNDDLNTRHSGEVKKTWVEVVKNKDNNEGEKYTSTLESKKMRIAKREVVVRVNESQKKILSKSLMGVKVNPIDFTLIQRQIREGLNDEAMSNPNPRAIFDEVRLHWDIFWSRLRRIYGRRMSYSVVIFLVDCYEWKMSDEWIIVKVDESNDDAKAFDASSELKVEETPPKVVVALIEVGGSGLKIHKLGVDPSFEK
ncbi:hypothetical protein PIB30_029803 [Stylosanthes scabra]|uniref:Uncharacterized protein n=1 Tax=Stylosanthes scabra TaxID=79078 RepID=A0ABU6TB49_9FABA|nr:hypothetical protein [Stylosanthes scabra]